MLRRSRSSQVAKSSTNARPSRFSPRFDTLEDRLALSGSTVNFAIVGDYGTASSILNVPNLLLGVPDTEGDVARLIHGWNPEFLLTVGDNNYLCGNQFDDNMIIELEGAILTGELPAIVANVILEGVAEVPYLFTTTGKGDLLAGSRTITGSNTTGLSVGMVVTGSGIQWPTGTSDPFYTKITEIVDGTTFKISTPATGAASQETLTFFPADLSLQQLDGLSHIDRNIGRYYSDFIYPYVTSSPQGQFGNGSPTGFNRMYPTPGNHDWADPLSDGGTSAADISLCIISESVQKIARLDPLDATNHTLILSDVSTLEVGMTVLAPGLTTDLDNPAQITSIDAGMNKITLTPATTVDPTKLVDGTTAVFVPLLLPPRLDPYLNFFAGLNPTNSPGLTLGTDNGVPLTQPYYYSFTQGTTSSGKPLIEFFAVDSDPADPRLGNGTPLPITREKVLESPQGLWLKAAMQSSQALYKIPYFHHAPYSSANDPDEGPNGEWMRLPFQEWGATAVIFGHVHNYERLAKADLGGEIRIPYILNGFGGAETSAFLGPVDEGSKIRYNGEVGAMKVLADEDHINFQFINSFGAVIDDYSTGPDYQFVRNLYQDVLNREDDPAGLRDWVAVLQNGASRSQVADAFWLSPEHRGLQVDGYYTRYLHRAADPGGRASWVNAFLAGASEDEIQAGFLISGEYAAAHTTDTSYVTGLYNDVLGRAPDAGQAGWVAALQNGASRQSVALDFLGSPEALTNLVKSYYTTFLNRPASPEEVAGWLAFLQSGQLTEDEVAVAFLSSDEFYNL